MEPADYLARLQIDGPALAATARQAPHAKVETCPGWDVTALLGHMSSIHRWAAEMLRTRAGKRVSRRDLEGPPSAPEAVLEWYSVGLTQLTTALNQIDPDDQVWNWRPDGDRRARFWHRRMANETAVHRWDAQAAAGDAQPIDGGLAVDGIDEYFELFLANGLRQQPVAALNGSIHLHATDIEGEWWLGLEPDRIERRHEHAKADAAVRGPASELLLWLWNRRPDDSAELQTFGNPVILDHFRAFAF
jgi:uncharacterized protein (TIGR03083 family)